MMGVGVMQRVRQAISTVNRVIRNEFWGLPLLSIIFNTALAFGLCAAWVVDDSDVTDLQPDECRVCVFIFTGDAAAAQTLLGMVSSASISIATLTFSLTVLSIQLAAVNYTPRILDEFLKDPVAKRCFAVNLGTFVYCFLVLWNTRQSTITTQSFVPYLAVNFVIIHMFAVMGMFIYFLQYFINGMRLESILHKASKSACDAADRLDVMEDTDDYVELPDVPAGAYKCLATQSGCHSGDFVIEGTLIGWVWPVDGDEKEFEKQISELDLYSEKKGYQQTVWEIMNFGVLLSVNRKREFDLTLGVQQLADIATRALSPGTNDPQTAIQCLDSLSVVFTKLSKSKFSRTVMRDSDDSIRVISPVHGYSFILAICMDPIRVYGKGDAYVIRRAMFFLRDMGAIATRCNLQRRVKAIRTQLDEWMKVAAAEFDDDSLSLSSIKSVHAHVLHSIDTANTDKVPVGEDKNHHKKDAVEGKGDENDGNKGAFGEESTNSHNNDAFTHSAVNVLKKWAGIDSVEEKILDHKKCDEISNSSTNENTETIRRKAERKTPSSDTTSVTIH
eukprot:CFRG7279T1